MSLPTSEDTPTLDMGAVLRPFWLLAPPPPVCFALLHYVPALTDDLNDLVGCVATVGTGPLAV